MNVRSPGVGMIFVLPDGVSVYISAYAKGNTGQNYLGDEMCQMRLLLGKR
jgi:hypothetical protein